MVLKVGNQQTVGSPQAFDKEHPPDLVSLFLSPSSCWFLGTRPTSELSLFLQGLGRPQSHPTSWRGQKVRPSRPPRQRLPELGRRRMLRRSRGGRRRRWRSRVESGWGRITTPFRRSSSQSPRPTPTARKNRRRWSRSTRMTPCS
jgi:hypothetical protein